LNLELHCFIWNVWLQLKSYWLQNSLEVNVSHASINVTLYLFITL
jgi:hypothetical protein